MRSFDLFRTLAFARNGQPGEDSVENHFPIAENVAKIQPGDVVVSEYEDYRRDKARAILDLIGLPKARLITTEDGKSKGSVWRLLPGITEHLDDNSLVLSKLPGSIKGTLVTQHELTPLEKKCGELGNVIREARLRTWSTDPVIRGLQLHQIERNFPFLYAVAHKLHAKMVDGGFTRLLLCSRDCFLLYRLMSRFFGPYEVEYFFTSRLTRYCPSETYAAYAKERLSGKTLIVDMSGFGNSLKYLTDQFGGTALLVASGQNVVPHLVAGGLRETSNLAPWPMCSDVLPDDDGPFPVFTNPTEQDWQKPEIAAMTDAFNTCVSCLPLDDVVPAPSYSLDYALSQMNDPAIACLWDDHLADSKAAYQLLKAAPLPACAVVIQ